MIEIARKLTKILSPREIKLAYAVLTLNLFVACIEVLGIASILPFIAVLSNPDLVTSNEILRFFYDYFGFTETDDFLFFMGIAVFTVLVTSILIKALGFMVQIHFAFFRNYSISTRLVADYIQRPYSWYLNNHSSELAAKVLNEVSRVVHEAMFTTLNVFSQGFVVVLLLAMLIALDPVLAIGSGVILGGCYTLIFLLVNRKMRANGEKVRLANMKRFKTVNEAFTGIKDVKILGLEDQFAEQFRSSSKTMASNNVSAKSIAEMPSFAMQGLVFGALVFFLLYLMQDKGSLEKALPMISVYAFAGYRLMPALQSIYNSLSILKFAESAVDALYRDVIESTEYVNGRTSDTQTDSTKEIAYEKSLKLKSVVFSYESSTSRSLDGLSLNIAKNTMVGLIGGSGAGKTTIADILLGLLTPDSGGIYIDDERISGKVRLRKLQKLMGYVPQQIFLTDDSIKANIAFGIPEEDVDDEAIVRAAKTANIHDFVTKELPEGYNTFVGERGVRLSGGQRQRIGLARALYHDPEILLLDEATSALDNITEKAVMQAVNQLNNKKTIIIIAHRLSTIENCDNIFLINKGRLLAEGTYDELYEKSELFRKMTLHKDEQEALGAAD